MAAHFIIDLLRLTEQTSRPHQQRVAARSELYAFCTTNQELDTEILLELGQSFTDCRRNRVASLGRSPNRPGFSDSDKYLQISNIEFQGALDSCGFANDRATAVAANAGAA
jgi:hypothetical protein